MGKQAVLFVNARSRRGREWFDDARRILVEKGMDLRRAEAFDKSPAMSTAVEDAVAQKTPLIVIGGGDGTLSANARHFVDGSSVLGVLPLGTGNAFARDLGIQPNVEAACEIISTGVERSVDLGIAEDDFFVNVVTVGLTVRIAEELTNAAKKRFGRFAYVAALVRAIRRAKPFRAKIESVEGTREFQTLQVVIGSGRYHAGPFPVSPDARIDDGKLSIYALTTRSRWDLLKMALLMPLGRQGVLEQVASFDSKGGDLKATPRQKVNVDGEISLLTPIKFGIAPGALRVMVPKDSPVAR